MLYFLLIVSIYLYVFDEKRYEGLVFIDNDLPHIHICRAG